MHKLQFSSTIWLVIIAVGAVLVATGNLNFNIARDREREAAASEKAFGLLQAEMNNNLNRAEQIRSLIPLQKMSSEPFETAAWSIVSTGGLLTRLEQQKMVRLIEAYYLVNLAESFRAQIVDRSIGIQSALIDAPKVTAQFQTNLLQTLDKLEPKLRELSEMKAR